MAELVQRNVVPDGPNERAFEATHVDKRPVRPAAIVTGAGEVAMFPYETDHGFVREAFGAAGWHAVSVHRTLTDGKSCRKPWKVLGMRGSCPSLNGSSLTAKVKTALAVLAGFVRGARLMVEDSRLAWRDHLV